MATQAKSSKSSKKKPAVKVSDLKPAKDAKGGGRRRGGSTSANRGGRAPQQAF